MNSNNGGTNQVGEQSAIDFLRQFVHDTPRGEYNTLTSLPFALYPAVAKAMESYAASRSVGYSLEQVKEIIVAFKEWVGMGNTTNRLFSQQFAVWAQTPEGKSLLERSEPVGVQDEKRFTENDMVEFAMTMIGQFKCGNENIWNRDLLRESLNTTPR